MPKINLDEDETLSEPIEFIIEGKTFKTIKITDRIFKKITELSGVAEQFAYLTGTKASAVRDLNLKKVAKAMKLVLQDVMDSMGISLESTFTVPVKEEKEDKETERKNA